MEFYLQTAAKNKGWEMEIVQNKKPYLVKYKKGSLFFYSSKFINFDINHQPAKLSSDKTLTYAILSREGIDIITIEEINSQNKKQIRKLYNKHSLGEKESVVLKPIDSFDGQGLFKCHNFNEVLSVIENSKHEKYCISTYYEHIVEMRFIMYRGKVEFIHPKYDSKPEFVDLKSQKELKIKLSLFKKMKKEAMKVANILKYDYIAVDFLLGKNGFKIIETNSNPYLFDYCEQSEKKNYKVIRFYEKMFDYKEKLLKLNKKKNRG